MLGCAFAAYGIILIVVGSARGGARLARALDEKEGFARLSDRSELLLAGAGGLLGRGDRRDRTYSA